jgi:hypothetical protein
MGTGDGRQGTGDRGQGLHLLFGSDQKVVVVSVVILLIILGRREDHADSAGGEVVNVAPHHWADVESKIRTIQMKLVLVSSTIIKVDVKAARHCDDELVEFLVAVASTLGSTRNIIEIINSLDVEWNMASTFDKGQVSTRILDDGKIDQLAIVDTVMCHVSISLKFLTQSILLPICGTVIILIKYFVFMMGADMG